MLVKGESTPDKEDREGNQVTHVFSNATLSGWVAKVSTVELLYVVHSHYVMWSFVPVRPLTEH